MHTRTYTRTYTRTCVPANIGAALGLCRCHATRCNHSFTFLLFFACFLPLLVLELIRQQGVLLLQTSVQAVTTQCRGPSTRKFLTLIGRLSTHLLQLHRTSHVAFGVNAQQLTQEAQSKLKCVTQVSKLQNKISLLQKAI